MRTFTRRRVPGTAPDPDHVKHRAVFLAIALTLAAAALAPAAGAQRIPGLGGRGAGSSPSVRPRQTTRRDTSSAARSAGLTQHDSITDFLLKLQGYTPVYYTGDSADYQSLDRTLRLRGASRVEREGNVITAKDSIVYIDPRDLVVAYGQPQGNSTTQSDPLSGDVFYYDLARRRANVLGARTKITENATWYVAGDVTDERGERIYANNSTFTSDDRADPAYHFKADRIMIIRNRILVGRPAYLYFKNVPVMALPFIVQDLEKGRRSGFLIPQFELNDIIRTHGGNNTRGTGREFSNIGYYWAMSPNLGLQLAGRWRSESYTAMRGDLDFNFRRHFLSGTIEGERFWQTDGPGRLDLNGNARWDMNERTNIALALGFASSTAFERNRTLDPFTQTADLSSNLAVTRRFDWGSLSLNAERRQSIANDDRTFSPRLSLNVNPINLFRVATVTVGFNGNESLQSFGDALVRRQPSQQERDGAATLGLAIGDFRVTSGASYTRNGQSALDSLPHFLADSAGVDTTHLFALPGRATDRISFNASTGYQLNLFASTRLTPSIGFSRDLVRRDTSQTAADSLRGVYGTFVAGPPRLNVGASLSTDLYGFFPGFGNYEAIRHHIQPIVAWTYSPAAVIRDSSAARIQRQVFGAASVQTVNAITVGFNQTFEAKVKQSHPVRGDSAHDTAQARGNAASPAPTQSQKITLLAINTDALQYSFQPINGYRFQTTTLSTQVRTDLLGGLQFTMTHDLFDQRLAPADSGTGSVLKRGRFSPFLTSFSTNFTLGQNSALFRWLGFARSREEQRVTERGQTPDSAGTPNPVPVGGATATGNNQMAGGGGPWSLSLNYSLTRLRRTPADTLPGVFQSGNSQVGASLTFQPTRNWAVSWRTDYSTTTGKFSAHTINLKRDLYRWQANFDYILAPNGNTSFAFSVHLIDLPDLKADYHESNLGLDRPANGTTGNLPPPVGFQKLPVQPQHTELPQ